MISAILRAQAEAWIRDDPDPYDRAELRALLAAAESAAESRPRAGTKSAAETKPGTNTPPAAESKPGGEVDHAPATTTAESAEVELADRFAARLRFGTAGIRGVMAPGPNRMNRAVVRATTAALAGWLARRDPSAQKSGVVIG
ncbi:MAG TPA: hypothetical protein VIV12_04770, partial [Streptosporangiaceae bacterium]